MYPAATFAALMIFHFYYKPRQLFYFMKKAPLGSLSLMIYTLAVMFFFPVYGVVAGSLLAYSLSLAFFFTDQIPDADA